MNIPAPSFRRNFAPVLGGVIRFQPVTFAPLIGLRRRTNLRASQFPRIVFHRNGKVVCRARETETEPDSDNNDKEISLHEEGDRPQSSESVNVSNNDEDKVQVREMGMLESYGQEIQNGTQSIAEAEARAEDVNDVQVASGSPLPGVKLDESIRIPKETIDILRVQVFGFDTFFVTSQEPYEGGVLFKGNLRGQAAKSYEKIAKRMQDMFGDTYKLFVLINPEDDKPVAVVVPRKTLQPDTTAVPEWFAAGTFGLVTAFTLLLRNVPALQSNFLSTFDHLELLKDGLPGALVTALVLGVHEVSHILVAKESGIKLGVPYFVPSWQTWLDFD